MTDTTPAAGELADALLRVAHRYETLLARRLDAVNLSPAWLSVLRTAEGDGVNQRTLAERLGQVESSVSTLVTRMTQAGLIRQSSVAGDRRQRLIVLTDDGRTALAAGQAFRERTAEVFFALVPLHHRRPLVELLADLLDSVTGDVFPAGDTHAA